MIEVTNQSVITLLVFLLGQTVLGIYWAGKMTKEMENVTRRLKDLDDVMKSTGFGMCQVHQQRLSAIEHRVEVLENKVC